MIRGSGQITLVDMTEGYTIFLSSEAISLSGGTSTLGTQQDATVIVTAFSGSDQVLPVIGTPICPANVTASVGSASGKAVPVTITFAAALASAGKVTIPVSVGGITINKDVSFSISFKGEGGGTSSYSYRLITSHAAIGKTDQGYNPEYITLTSRRTIGTSGPTNYAGRFVIETTADNTAWTTAYSSTNDETTTSYTIPDGIIAVRCSLYMAGGTSTLLDQQTIPIVTDGASGYTVVLSNESHIFAGTQNAAIPASAEFQIAAFKGGTQIATTIGTITGLPTGMTATITGNGTTSAKVTISVTAQMVTPNGILTIPITTDGKSFEKQFSYALALTGEDAYSVMITASNGNIFKSYSESTVLTAHTYKSGAEVTPTGTIVWLKDGVQVGTGRTLTVSASDISGKSVYEARLTEDGSIISCNTITVSIQQDIVSVTWYYKLVNQSDSAPAKPTSMTPSGWATTEPDYTEGSTKKLYETKRTVFSTNTFSYSDVSLSSSYEAAKTAYNKAVQAQSAADGKTTAYYRTEAPTGTFKVNDIWFDTNDGNKMYYWNGTAWTPQQFGTNAIGDNAITAEKILVGDLAAVSANMGTITAGQIRVETIIGEDRFVGILRTSGGSPSADGGIRMFEIVKDIGNTQTDYQSQFYAGTDGRLFALNADIRGIISASGGDIANWHIVKNDVNRGTTAQGGHLYNSGMYCHSQDETYEYEIGMKADSGDAGYLAYYVKRIPLGAEWTDASAENLFFVRNNGSLYARNADISGKISASSGVVGGFVIGTNRLTATSGGLTTGLQTPANGVHAIAVGATAENDWSSAPFRVTHAGAVTATALNAYDAHLSGCVIDDTLYVGSSSSKSGISGNNGTLYLNAAYAGGTATQMGNAIQSYGAITGYGRYLWLQHSMASGENMRVRLTNTASQASGVTSGCMQISSSGAFGLYNIANTRWLIYDNGSNVVLPTAMTVSGEMTFSTAPILNNAQYMMAHDNTGDDMQIIGLSSGNRLYLGPTAQWHIWPDRTVIANEIGNVYVYNSSGTQILLSTAVSDRRLKHDITDLDSAHDFIMGLAPKKFKLNGEKGDRYHFGFIAQDVRPVLESTIGDGVMIAYNPVEPESDEYDPDDENTFEYSMDYIQLIAPMVSMIQEQQKQIDELRDIIKTLVPH